MKKILSILVILTSLCIASAQPIEPTVIGSKTVWSENNFFGFNWGDRVEEISFSDGTTEEHYIRFSTLFKPAFITSIPSSINVQKSTTSPISIPVSYKGVSCMFTSDAYHLLEVSYEGTLITKTDSVTVICNQPASTTYSIPAYKFGSIINVDGTYSIKTKEKMIFADGSYVSGDSKYINLIVGSGVAPIPTSISTPVPTSTTVPTSIPTSIPTTPTPTVITTPSPCISGYLYNSDSDTCVKIQQSLPGFEAILALIGLIATAGYILRRKE